MANEFMKASPRIAVYGLGAFGTLHARTLRALPEARLTAVGNRTRAKAGQLAGELNVAGVFESMEELIDRKLADAVIIATNSETHVSSAKMGLTAGMHVLVEKPVGRDVAEVASLLQAARESGCVAMAGHICVFHSLIGPLLERVRRKGFASAHFVRHRPHGITNLFPEEHPITLTMVHDLYVAAQMVAGEEPIAWEATEARNADGQATQSWALLRWHDGRVITFHSHWILPDGAPADGFDWVEVFADNFYTKVQTNPQNWTWNETKTEWPVALEISTIGGRPTGMLAEELRSFIAACQGAPINAGCRVEDALQVQGWTDKLLHSARQRKIVC